MKKVLVANRGEIAVRVLRALREMGIGSVAVYSEADAGALHVRLADEAVGIGGSEPGSSYLDMGKVLEAALATGAEGVHPGYGFLSERAEFAEACLAAGIAFIGPSAAAMRALGAKIDAKRLAVENGVPVTPGFFEPGAGLEDLRRAAAEIGYPVMLKASAGGGGRGMRVVGDEGEFESACRLAREEAEKAFGDGAMMVEKLIDRPRHIEVQVLSDGYGNVACLFERECSLQRRHQKVVEEAPSPAMTEELWGRMQAAARRLVLASGYTGAGTVEFMVDGGSGEFYFLEVNARLQVEHPVTEMVTGVDLVQWQIRIARGERLELPEGLMTGDRRAIRGHAMEARVVAEDPGAGFLPSVGAVLGLAGPVGPGVRFDTGYEGGDEVSRFYDSLVGKVIVHGETRAAAARRLRLALEDTHVLGVKTNVAYLQDVVSSMEFLAGEFDTGFLGREFGDWLAGSGEGRGDDMEVLGALVSLGRSADGAGEARIGRGLGEVSPAWGVGDGFRNAPDAGQVG